MKVNGKTLNKCHSEILAKLRWVKKMKTLLAPADKLNKVFSIDPNAIDNPGTAVVIKYNGVEGEPKDQVRMLENLLDCRFSFEGKSTVKKGRLAVDVELDPELVEFMFENGDHEPDFEPVNVIPIRATPKLATV